MDEPTSGTYNAQQETPALPSDAYTILWPLAGLQTGLDATMSYDLIRILKNIATNERRTVLCSIHQPSSQIFYTFDSLLLLMDGKVRPPCEMSWAGYLHDADGPEVCRVLENRWRTTAPSAKCCRTLRRAATSARLSSTRRTLSVRWWHIHRVQRSEET